MPDNKFIQDLHQVIDGSVSSFDSSIGSIQKDIYKEISMLLKDLVTSGDTIKPTAKNISIIGKKKQFIYESELEDVVKGNFKEFDQENGKIDSRTDLPSGMIPGTNADNFKIYRGGYNCGHQLVPVSEVVVPKNIRMDVYSKQGIKYDSDGFAN